MCGDACDATPCRAILNAHRAAPPPPPRARTHRHRPHRAPRPHRAHRAAAVANPRRNSRNRTSNEVKKSPSRVPKTRYGAAKSSACARTRVRMSSSCVGLTPRARGGGTYPLWDCQGTDVVDVKSVLETHRRGHYSPPKGGRKVCTMCLRAKTTCANRADVIGDDVEL